MSTMFCVTMIIAGVLAMGVSITKGYRGDRHFIGGALLIMIALVMLMASQGACANPNLTSVERSRMCS